MLRSWIPFIILMIAWATCPAQITFIEQPGLAFLDDTSYLRGISWVDVDNDNDLDVCVSGAGGTFPDFVNVSAIFINQGLNVFSNTGLLNSMQNNPMGHGWADIENDGDLDLYLGATWNAGGINELWLNNNGSNFSQITNSGATPNQALPYEGTVSWADYDNDGFVDLHLARWNNAGNKLYQNNGNGTFTEITGVPIVTDAAWTSAGIWGDFDNDRDQDLYVVNYQTGSDPGANDLFVNNGDGTFTKSIIAGAPISNAQNTRTANWIDANNDGWLDIYVANQNSSDHLYLNNADGTFQTGFTAPSGTSWSSNWGDFDNDGDLDLATIGFFGTESKLWENDGNASFTDVTSSYSNIFPTATNGSMSNGLLWVDYDLDGWLDLHVIQPNTSSDALYKNLGQDCKTWLEIKCTGTTSNRAAIGTTIRAKAVVNGQSIWQMRHVSAQTSKPGQNPLWQHFGFGETALIDSLVIEWPSGETCIFTGVATNQLIEISENCTIQAIIPPPSLSGTNQQFFLCDLNVDTVFQSPSGPGGVWTSDCGSCIDQMGTFSPQNLPIGMYTVYYSLDGSCGSIDTFEVTLGTGTGSSELITICPDGSDLQLMASPIPGGTWSANCGMCISDQGLFFASQQMPGMYEVYYTATADCGMLVDTFILTLENAYAGENTTITWCENSEAQDLTPLINGNPTTNGQWTNDQYSPIPMPFEPTDSTTTLFYLVSDNVCSDTSEITVVIQATPTLVVPNDTAIFAGSTISLLVSGANNYSWEPANGLDCDTCSNPLFSGQETTTFLVLGENEFGCSDTASLTIEILPAISFEFPNAFTPNGDGNNDEFKAVFQGEIFREYHLQVYNRWGDLIFESRDATASWDGTLDGEPATMDVYAWVLNYQLISGEEGMEKGDVSLLR